VSDAGNRRHIVVSTDAHAGADLRDYKPYLATELHEEFERWAADFHDPWADFDMEMEGHEDEGIKMGRLSFVSPYSWDSEARLGHMDAEGIAAEVLFPNTVPPFYPSGVISAPPPGSAEEYRLRWAGVQAHNRWMADFCSLAPDRRIGLAQIFLHDVEAAVAEAHWAKDAGLRGLVVPADHLSRQVYLFEKQFDPFWAACTELDLPVHRHALSLGESEAVYGPAAPAIAAHETEFFFVRALSQLVFGGIFERFPTLKFVFSEGGISWALGELRKLDAEIRFGQRKGHGAYPVFHRAVEQLSMTASEYFARNCWIGASLIRPQEMAVYQHVGVDKIMWGADYPHTEGTYPYSELSLRLLFADVPEEDVRKMICDNAALLYGLDLAPLQAIADRIGPTFDRVATPVSAAELPARTMSATVGSMVDALPVHQ
jgi:predicted TIM-barrel fold metal-dependent hydrolase